MLKNIVLGGLFATVGLVVAVVNVINNAVSVNNGTFAWNDVTGVVIGLALASALFSLSLGLVWKRSAITSLLMMVAVAGCVMTSVGYTLSRLGDLADTGVSAAVAHNEQRKRLSSEIIVLTDERNQEARRDRRGRISAKRGRCGKKCQAIEDKIEARKLALAKLGPAKSVDPAGQRLEAALGWAGVTADGYRKALPVVTAGTLELSISLLLTIAGMFLASGVPVRSGRIIDVTPIDPVVEQLRLSGAASNRELSKRLGWSEAKTSRQVKRLCADGQVVSQQHGKAKLISLAAL
jgi:hypothetical protein